MAKNTIVLLNGETIQALAMAKALKESGYNIISICDSIDSYGYCSKHVDEKIIAPSIHEHTNLFHEFFVDWLKTNKVDAIIPMNDFSAEYLSKNKAELGKYTKFLIPDYEIFTKGYDKHKLMQICKEWNYPHPLTLDLSLENYEAVAEKMVYPALIKPNITTGGRGFARVTTPKELIEKYPSIKKDYGDCHVQEFIPPGGAQYKVELFINNGELINATVMNKIRFYPGNGGSSCCSISIQRDDLVALCFNILKTIGWYGFADFDLIEDPRTNEVKVMEINPRVPACIRLSLVSGIDFATMIADATLGKPLQKYEYFPGKVLRYMALDALWFAYSNNRFSTSPAWLKLFGKNIYWQECGGGLKAMLTGSLSGLKKQLNPKFREAKAGLR